MHLSKVKIQGLMEQKGISTLKELAERIGVTPNQLSVMLSSNYEVLKSRVCDLCDVLETDVESIVESNQSVTVEADCEDGSVTNIELFAGAGAWL